MYLSFIERFGGHVQFGDGKGSLLHTLTLTLTTIHRISLHEKSAKAIRHQRRSIEKEILRLEGNDNTSKECRELLDMAKSVLNLNGSYCCRCNKSLSKTEVMECNGCGRMSYCSRACQKEDWSNGHKLACCKTYTDATAGHFQGRYEPELPEGERAAAKLKDLEINMK